MLLVTHTHTHINTQTHVFSALLMIVKKKAEGERRRTYKIFNAKKKYTWRRIVYTRSASCWFEWDYFVWSHTHILFTLYISLFEQKKEIGIWVGHLLERTIYKVGPDFVCELTFLFCFENLGKIVREENDERVILERTLFFFLNWVSKLRYVDFEWFKYIIRCWWDEWCSHMRSNFFFVFPKSVWK